MNNHVIVHYKQHSFLDILDYAFSQRMINDKQKQQHILTYKAFFLKQIYYTNHNQSTAISIKHYERIQKAILYVVTHATPLPIYTQLSSYTIEQLYTKGLLRLKMDVAQLSTTLKQLKEDTCYFPNDRYQDVLFHQIPQYIQLLHSYDAHIHYHHTKEDLDYPLIDGIPLFLHMYHKDGVDLVKEYVRRLQIERQYCMRFSSSLETFHSHYEKQHHIHSEDIHVNLFGLVLNQCFANIILYQKEAILLQKQDIVRLKQYLIHNETAHIAKQRITSYIQTLPSSLQDYILQHQGIIKREWMKFIKGTYMLFVYEQKEEELLRFHIPVSSKDFTKELNTLQAKHSVEEKVTYVMEQEIQVYDMLDLFEHDIFIEDEYVYYFQHIQTIELALLLQILIPHLQAFHHQASIINILNEIDCKYPWHHYFKHFITAQPTSMQQEILQLAQRIRLT